MSDDTPVTVKLSTSRSIAFHRDGRFGRYVQVIATTDTENANAPIELIRPYGDGSGNEVLVSLTAEEWIDLIAFVEEHGLPKVERS